MSIKVGTFTKTTSGAPVSQVVNGVGFQPKALLLWTSGGTTSDVFRSGLLYAAGITTGASESFTQCSGSEDASGTSNSSVRIAAKALSIIQWGEVVLAECDLTSFDTDGFTLNWTTNNATGHLIHFFAIGGSVITNAKTVSWEYGTATGNLAITGVGFQPDCVLHVYDAGISTLPTNSVNGAWGIGFMKSAVQQGCIGGFSHDGQTISNTSRVQRTDRCIYGTTESDGTNFNAQFVSMDSDGFTIDRLSPGAAFAPRILSLCLKGGLYSIGSFTKSTGGAPVSQVVAGVSFRPDGVLLVSDQNTVTTSVVAHGRACIGSYDGSSESASAFSDLDADDPISVDAIDSSGKCFIKLNNNTPSVDAEADGFSLDSDGFTLRWTTNDAVATEILYLAFGTSLAASFLVQTFYPGLIGRRFR